MFVMPTINFFSWYSSIVGKICIIKCLLDMRRILMKDESRYILNELYVNHYIVWTQKLSIVIIVEFCFSNSFIEH